MSKVFQLLDADALGWLILLATCAGWPHARADPLLEGFETPPDAAKPRVWWHWMNGNVTKEGIRLDLQWMKRIGVGGFNVIQASFETPSVVDEKLLYQSPGWQDALRSAVELADREALEVSIASSPGWSGTGGPGVTVAQAMKKLVWSTTSIEGGKHFAGHLTSPPRVAGPFQDVDYVPRTEIWVDIKPPPEVPDFYADAAVVAFQLPQTVPVPPPAEVSSSDGPIDAALLSDGDLKNGVSLRADRGPVWVQFTYDHPQTIRSIVLGVPVPTPGAYVYTSALRAELEAQDETGRFQAVAALNVTIAPQVTVSFNPVTAKIFRVVFDNPAGGNALGLPFEPSTTGLDVSFIRRPSLPPRVVFSELSLMSTGRVNEFERKAGFALADDYGALATPQQAANAPVAASEVIDLTRKMKPDGSLDWRAPPGRWTVLRLGYSLTGMINYPAPAEATGLEIDKLNGPIAQGYMSSYLDEYASFLPTSLMGAHGLNALTSDSTEAGPQNWTNDMLDQFRRLRGYDPTPWLPALTGVIVESAAKSDKFLWDFRRTIAQLRSEGHEAGLAASARARGLKVYAEALENGRPELGRFRHCSPR